MNRKQFWITINAALAIVAGAMTPWLLRTPQTGVHIAPGEEAELPVAEFADVQRVKPQTDLVGTKNLFHPQRGIVDDGPVAPDFPPTPAPETETLTLQSIGRIHNLACANIKVGDATQVVPLGKQVAGTPWRLAAVRDKSAMLSNGDETLNLTVGVSR
jgi:hypothetical protein